MNWFGESWGASVCDPATHVETPVGAECGWCSEQIEAGDAGVCLPVAAEIPYMMKHHLNCWLRQVVGSAGHQNETCSCFGDGDCDPPDMTVREAADAAVEAFYRKAEARAGSHER